MSESVIQSAAHYLASSIDGVARLTATEERELAARVREGDLEARKRLVTCNIPYAINRAKAARPFFRGACSPDELVQLAMIGLNDAVDTFDPDKGRFTTHASHRIFGSIAAARGESRLIHVPYGIAEAIVRERRGRANSAKDKKFLASDYAAFGRRAMAISTGVVGLDFDPIEEIEATDSDPSEEDAGPLLASVASMPDREREVIRMRFGIGGDAPMTLSEIGKAIGLSRERVRQIQSDALLRLRSMFDPSARDTVGLRPPIAPRRLASRGREVPPTPEARAEAGRYRGVTARPGGRFQAAVYLTGRGNVYAGSSSNAPDAARMYDRKARELLGDRAKLNFPEDHEPATRTEVA